MQSSKEILDSTSITSKNNNINTSITSRRVQRLSALLHEILKPKDNCTYLFYKFAWKYEENSLIRLANEARETDKQGCPTRLFVYLVKKELGYEKAKVV